MLKTRYALFRTMFLLQRYFTKWIDRYFNLSDEMSEQVKRAQTPQCVEVVVVPGFWGVIVEASSIEREPFTRLGTGVIQNPPRKTQHFCCSSLVPIETTLRL